MPSKTSGLLRGLLLLPLARWLVATPAAPNAVPVRAPSPPRFLTARLIVALVGTIALGLGTAWLVNQYDATLPTIGDPPPTGSIHLYFDRPDVTAQLDVQVTSDLVTYKNKDYASDSYVIRVLAEGLDQSDLPMFYVALGGSALPRDDYPDGSDRGDSDGGCSLAIMSDAPELACITTKGSPESAWVSDEAKEEIVVVSGRLKPIGDQGEGLAYIDVTAYAQTLAKSGETEVFQLPTAGTTYIPPSVGDDVAISIDDIAGLKVPDPITIIVRYQWLSPTDQLESVSVEPFTRQPLTWVETFSTTLTASGTITDSREQRDADRVTFFWGVFAGILGSLLLPLLGWWWLTIAAWWRWGVFRRSSKQAAREGAD